MFTIDWSIHNKKSVLLARRAVRLKLAHHFDEKNLVQISTSKKYHTHGSSDKSKGSHEMSSVKKVNVNPQREQYPSVSKYDYEREIEITYDDFASKGNRHTPLRDKDEHSEYRIKSDKLAPTDNFSQALDDIEMDIAGTKRAGDSKGTPRLINFSGHSRDKGSPQRETNDFKQDLWLAAGGFKGAEEFEENKTDYLTMQDTKRNTLYSGGKMPTDREKDHFRRDLPPQAPQPRKRAEDNEDYKFVDAGISQFIPAADLMMGKNGKLTNDSDFGFHDIDREIENLNNSMQRIGKNLHPELQDDRQLLAKLEPAKQPAPHGKPFTNVYSPIGKTDTSSVSREPPSYQQILPDQLLPEEQSHFLSFRPPNPGAGPEASQQRSFKPFSEDQKVLMHLTINDVVLQVVKGDNSERIARRYFKEATVYPSKKQLAALMQLITEKVNRKIDCLEKFFRRKISKKEFENLRPKSISIDLANKENRHPNLPPPRAPEPPKPSVRHSPITKFTSNSSIGGEESTIHPDRSYIRPNNFTPKLKKHTMSFVSNGGKSVDLNIRRDDDPREVARLLLLQRGMGLANLDSLAESIREFQRKTFHAKKI